MKPYQQGFAPLISGNITGIEVWNPDRVRYEFDPPVHLEVGQKYAFDPQTLDLLHVITEDYAERIGRARLPAPPMELPKL